MSCCRAKKICLRARRLSERWM